MVAPHLADQKREVIITQATFHAATPLAPAATFDSGILAMGADFPAGGGFDAINGMISADQPFTVWIDQGTDGAAQDLRTVLTAVLQASGNYSALVRVLAVGEHVQIILTNNGVANLTDLDGTIALLPAGQTDLSSAILTVQGADAVGVAPANNPFVAAGVDVGGLVQRLLLAEDDLAAPAHGLLTMGKFEDPQDQVDTGDAAPIKTDDYGNLYSRPYDGILELAFASVGSAVAINGLHSLYHYQLVPAANDDGDAIIPQSDAYGHPEPANYNRPLGSGQVVEQSPPEYDMLNGTAKVSAALPAAGAYDVAVEISTGGRAKAKFWYTYTRGGVGGSFRVLPEGAVTIGGADTWSPDGVVNTGAFAAGANVNSQFQSEDFSSQTSGAAAEASALQFDIARSDKIRISSRELGAVGTPGTLEILYKLYNI